MMTSVKATHPLTVADSSKVVLLLVPVLVLVLALKDQIVPMANVIFPLIGDLLSHLRP